MRITYAPTSVCSPARQRARLAMCVWRAELRARPPTEQAGHQADAVGEHQRAHRVQLRQRGVHQDGQADRVRALQGRHRGQLGERRPLERLWEAAPVSTGQVCGPASVDGGTGQHRTGVRTWDVDGGTGQRRTGVRTWDGDGGTGQPQQRCADLRLWMWLLVYTLILLLSMQLIKRTNLCRSNQLITAASGTYRVGGVKNYPHATPRKPVGRSYSNLVCAYILITI